MLSLKSVELTMMMMRWEYRKGGRGRVTLAKKWNMIVDIRERPVFRGISS